MRGCQNILVHKDGSERTALHFRWRLLLNLRLSGDLHLLYLLTRCTAASPLNLKAIVCVLVDVSLVWDRLKVPAATLLTLPNAVLLLDRQIVILIFDY